MKVDQIAATPRERPILFSGPMVRALLDGRKTQTRRIKKERLPSLRSTRASRERDDCPYGVPGDRLWVRETWAVDGPLDQVRREHEDMMPGLGHGPYFRADPVHENTGLTWRPSIHMYRWMSRILLELTEVRVRRLQDIGEEDARAEGCEPKPGTYTADFALHGYVAAYRDLWNDINGPGAWDANPWVWALTFRRV